MLESARLLNVRMNDGSRHFAELPETRDWHAVRAFLEHAGGVTAVKLVTDDVTEAWVDWTYRGHQFSANNQFGAWWVFVADPDCPDTVLEEMRDTLARFLNVTSR